MSGNINILEILWHSGPVVKFVLLVLVIASIFSWAIVLRKWRMFGEVKMNNRDFLDIYQNAKSLRDVSERVAMLPFSPYKLMFHAAYGELAGLKTSLGESESELSRHFERFGMENLERALKKGVNQSSVKLDNGLSTLASIGSVTPFVGLFGTVWGIIDSFQGLAGGGATLDAVAPGIAEALVATAVGLFAAIPAVWFYNKFSSQNTQISSEMESFGQEFLNTVERSLAQSGHNHQRA